MYFATYSGVRIFDVLNPDLLFLSCSISEKRNNCATCTFELPRVNPYWDKLRENSGILQIFDEDTEVFRGTITNVSGGIESITYTAMDALYWLNLIRKPPFVVETPQTIEQYFTALITQYNDASPEDQQIKIGEIKKTGTWTRERKYEYTTMMDLISEVVSDKGGEIYLQYYNDDVYFYYSDIRDSDGTMLFDDISKVTDYEIESDNDTLVTRVYGINNEGLTMADANEGLDYLVNEDAEIEFGRRIDGTVTVDTDDPSVIKTYSQAYLTRYSKLSPTIQIKAQGISTAPVGSLVHVYLPILDIDEELTVSERTIDISDPTKSEVIIGGEAKSLTMYLSKG